VIAYRLENCYSRLKSGFGLSIFAVKCEDHSPVKMRRIDNW
jgi:hypothetical protein